MVDFDCCVGGGRDGVLMMTLLCSWRRVRIISKTVWPMQMLNVTIC